MSSTKMNTYLIEVSGLVQGVGFRPFVYRLANQLNLSGWVTNTNENVLICINCDEDKVDHFVSQLQIEAPPASEISTIRKKVVLHEKFTSFEIKESIDASDRITEISPDIAVCSNCLTDMKFQDHRINYPFLNCTNCGPRFTIITDLPYDRANTTMSSFVMCEECQSEYRNIMDRRFHAQPVACNQCGPQYELVLKSDTIKGTLNIVVEAAELIDSGGIVAIKGIGGYFLACDAHNDQVVTRLRNSKTREGKPFAVMFRNIEAVKKYTILNREEEELLLSWRRPIVILKERQKLASGVSNGLNTIGTMLPYMPFHYLLFEKLDTSVIVLTSGNIADEPILIKNDAALDVLGHISDGVLTYNRDIYNRTDDSVMSVINHIPRILRRSRGFVPSPVPLGFSAEGIMGAGAELVNCFCIGKSTHAILSQHIGDLKNFETYDFYQESIGRFTKIFRLQPKYIAHDLHPDYLSTRYANSLDMKKIPVQHHHAHIASAMAEHKLDEEVIGVSFDGTGLGDDNNIWGGEFLVCDLNRYHRFSHFKYIPMPGGDAVTHEPWRMAVSYLYGEMGKDLLRLNLPFLTSITPENISLVMEMIDKQINTPYTSSSGRLFDAISALLNVCTHSKFHAEAPMRLESIAAENESGYYNIELSNVMDFGPCFHAIISDLKRDIPVNTISARFHNTVIFAVEQMVQKMRAETGIKKVVLSGGTFQNRYLLERLEAILQQKDYLIISQKNIPCNDGGIALGQLAIAAKRRDLGLI